MQSAVIRGLVSGFMVLLLFGLGASHDSSGGSKEGQLVVEHLISPDRYRSLTPDQQALLLRLAADSIRGPRLSFCWSEGADPEVIQAFLQAANHPLQPLFTFQDYDRWFQTATDPGPLQRGDPTTLTWGFIPNGVDMFPGDTTDASCRVIHTMDNLYGAGPGGDDLTLRPWFPLFERAFNAWAEVSGLHYVYEPNDDGLPYDGGPGVLGVRADIRIGGHFIDGNPGGWNIYGYSSFPPYGDMMLDTHNTAELGDEGNESRLLRNLVTHENGHGLGFGHPCPDDRSKVMEGTVTTFVDGPQDDDIRAANRGYGDLLEYPEQNDTPGLATDLGALDILDSTGVAGLSIDGVSDEDYFSFVATGERLRLTVRVVPRGAEYSINHDCVRPDPFFDSRVVANLDFGLLGPNSTDVLAYARVRPAGQTESLTDYVLPVPGTYLVQVFGDGITDEVQRYDLEVLVAPGPPPVAQCRDIRSCSGAVNPLRVNAGSYDPEGDPINFTLEPPGPYPPGENSVMFIVDDGVLADTCMALITVNTPPVAACEGLVVEADSSCGTVAVDPSELENGSLDPDGDEITFSLEPPGPFGAGTTTVQFIATDGCGASDTCETSITVNCSVPVQLLSFEAVRMGEGSRVRWEVTEDDRYARFQVYREDAIGGTEPAHRSAAFGAGAIRVPGCGWNRAGDPLLADRALPGRRDDVAWAGESRGDPGYRAGIDRGAAKPLCARNFGELPASRACPGAARGVRCQGTPGTHAGHGNPGPRRVPGELGWYGRGRVAGRSGCLLPAACRRNQHTGRKGLVLPVASLRLPPEW